MTGQLLGLLGAMVGDGVGTGEATVTGADDLRASEAVAVERAIARRRAEFAAGRRAARLALDQIGHRDATLPVGADRAPLWPEGATGSITHDAGLALAVAVPVSVARSIGIDLTEAAILPDGVRDQILRHPDETRLTDLEARAAFSAKESLFKALSPHVGFVFGFSAAVVEIDLSAGTFAARLTHSLGAYQVGDTWLGRVAIDGPRLITSLVVRMV